MRSSRRPASAAARLLWSSTFRTVLLATTALCVLPMSTTGCESCSKDAHVGELKSHHGTVSRDTAKSKQEWQAANDGAKLAMGDGLKTAAGADAIVHLTTGGNIAVSSDTTIRFLPGTPNAKGGRAGSKLAIETGEASIDADDHGLTVETTIGVAQIEPGGKLRVSADGTGTSRVEVVVGAARLETEDGGVALAPGKSFEVSLGGAVIEREIADASADASKTKKPDVPPPEVDAGAATGPIAVVVKGAGVRVQTKGETAWKPAAEGEMTIAPGDSLDVPGGASVDIRRGARHARVTGAGKYVAGDADTLLRASSGHVEIEATSEEVAVEVPGGVVVAKPEGGKSRVDADVGNASTRVSVRQGKGEVRGRGANAEPMAIRAGEAATLSPKGVAAAVARAPEKTDFTIRAGDSIIIRDPKPPTALGFDFSAACPSGSGVVSRGEGATMVSARGEKRAGMFLPAGHHDYAVRCIGPDGVEDKPAASGSVTVVADAARAELPRLPPSTVVDMDGRRYTLLYQNLLPAVIARWADGPQTGSFVLVVDNQRTKSTTPKQSLKSGAIGEGTHTLHFETEDGSKRSVDTTLVIKFDNAAPAASVREPADGSFGPGDTVKVAGVVVEGWTVSVNGVAVALDEQKRFSTMTTVPAGENAIVLKLSHPKRGTVYYVRHAR